MYLSILLLINTYHHVYFVDSANFCNGNRIPSVDRELSECNSCSGICGNIINETQPCSCDDLCVLYRDCCADFDQYCTRRYVTAQYTSKYYGPVQSSCIDINEARYEMTSTPTFSMMVTGCYNDSVLCEYNMLNISFILEHGSPVIDILYGVMFVNAKCAVCNGVPSWRFRPLKATLLCESLQEMDISEFMDMIKSNISEESSNNPWFGEELAIQKDTMDLKPGSKDAFQDPMDIVRDIASSRTCHAAFGLLKVRRHCIKKIETCPNNCTNKEMVHLCIKGHHALVRRNYPTYRNIYCALCNVGSSAGFTCGFATSLGISPAGSLSISLLFDVSRDDRVILQSLSTRCQNSNQRIPGGIRCGEIVCTKGYTSSGQGCSKDVNRLSANVTFSFGILIKNSRSCNQTDNVEALKDELHTAFNYVVGSLLNESKPTVEVNISHSCFDVKSDYSLDILVFINSSVGLQNISSSIERFGILAVWNVFNETLYASNTPGDSIRITSENFDIVYTKHGPQLIDCIGFVQAAGNASWSPNARSFEFSKHAFEKSNYRSIICVKNETSDKISNASEGLGFATIVLSSSSLFSLGLRVIP